MKKDSLIIIAIILCGIIFYGATLRGNFGNPGPAAVANLNQQGQPFELSPERGRYAQIYVLANDHTYTLTQAWANVASPDVGVVHGRYYSFFAPGVSYMALPFYIIGAKFDLGQVAAFGFMTLVTIANLILIYLIGRRIMKLPTWAAFFAALIFGFGSTAWGYAVTLYEHQPTVLMLLLSFYSVWKFRQKTNWAWFWAILVGFCYGLGIFVDYPDVIMLFPVIIYFLMSVFSIRELADSYKLTVRWVGMCAAIGFIAITGFQLWNNQHYFGSWKTLAGGLPSYVLGAQTNSSAGLSTPVPGATASSSPAVAPDASITASTTAQIVADESQTQNKDVVGFFKEQDIPNSFFVLMFSSERGLLFFCPIFILALVGIYYAFTALSLEEGILLLAVLANVLLYSSWGDPWGGWAYGPRYLILSMSVLSLFVGLALAKLSSLNVPPMKIKMAKIRSLVARVIAFILFAYGAFVALLGALVTDAIPKTSEAVLLPIKFHNFLVPLNLLSQGTNDSFIYNAFLYSDVTIRQYFVAVYLLVLIVAAFTLFILYEEPVRRDSNHKQ